VSKKPLSKFAFKLSTFNFNKIVKKKKENKKPSKCPVKQRLILAHFENQNETPFSGRN